MRTWSLLLLLLIATNALAGAVTYRWVDADGVHYSDQPHSGAEKLYLGQTQAASSASLDSAAGNAPSGTQGSGAGARRRAEQPFQYTSCAVVQPADDQVLLEVESVTVAVEAHPAKRSNDHAVLRFDGTEIEAATADQLDFRITPIDRGTHTVAAELRDSNNRAVCKSALVTFHVRQPSVLAPANPTRHR
jgi:hypothetical protein